MWFYKPFLLLLLSLSMQLTKSFLPLSSRFRFVQRPRMSTAAWSSIDNFQIVANSLLLVGNVTKGYGRGSKKLGVPTANLPYFDSELSTHAVERGVYFGWAKVQGESNLYPIVANIGKSPTFVDKENPVNVVEAHLISRTATEDFYDKELRVALTAFLRAEATFPGLDELLKSINNDIAVARKLDEESTFDKLTERRLALKSVDDCLNPIYRLCERRVKLSEFLSSPVLDDVFRKKYNCLNAASSKAGSGDLALWCSLLYES